MTNRSEKQFGSLGFFFDEDRGVVLLHLRDDKTPHHPNKWSFFGGDQEGNETPVECFVREIKEELGIQIPAEEAIPLTNYFNKEFGIQRYVFFVKKFIPKSEIRLTEGKDCDWVPLEKVFEYDLTEKTVNDLKTFLQKYYL